MAVAHPELAGRAVHFGDPRLDRARSAFRQQDGGIIGGNRGDPVEQRIDRGLVASLEEQARSLARPFIVQLLTDRIHGVGLEPPVGQHLERKIGCHHLGDRGRQEASVDVARMEHLA